MAVARVVEFNGVTQERIDELSSRMSEEDRPEELPATEAILLHDAAGGKSLAILFFENEADYAKGDEFLNSMPSDETPGNRASVTKYAVAVRMTA